MYNTSFVSQDVIKNSDNSRNNAKNNMYIYIAFVL